MKPGRSTGVTAATTSLGALPARLLATVTRLLPAAMLVAFLAGPALAQMPGLAQEDGRSPTKLVLLGTGNPNPTPARSGPAVAIVVGERAYIIDFGPGVVRRATEAARKLALPALEAENLRFAFLTHLHSDHTAGFPDLIFTPWVMGREQPLRLFGPRGTEEMTRNILEAYKEDILIRINGLQPSTERGWQVNAHDAEPGFVFSDRFVRVEAFAVCHGSWDQAFGYRFTTWDKVIVISGDTTYCPVVAEMAKGADILLHEVYSQKAFEKELSADWQAYHRVSHTSTRDLARIAGAARPKLVVLYHQLFWGGVTEEEILAEIAADYDGAVVSGKDLDVF